MPLLFCLLLGEIDGGLRATSNLEFLKNVLEVMPYGFVAQVHRPSDFFIGLEETRVGRSS